MPSGSKRRKAAAAAAAKKKKEQETPTGGSEATTFNGGDDLKGQDSDGGEVSSPASQDLIQSGGQSFTEEGGDRESSPVRQIDAQKVNVEEVDVGEGVVGIVRVDEDEGRVEITKELKLDEVSGGGDLSVEVGTNSERSADGSSSSSSSDGEEVHIEKTKVVQDLAKVEEVYEVVEATEDSQVPAIVLEEVANVSEATPVEELYEDWDKPVLSELNSELKATQDDALPVILPTVMSHGETSNVDTYNVNDAEDNVLPPSDSPIAVTRNGAGHHPKDPEIQDSFENQTPVLQAPLSVQRTSWKGCCGLFEVFTGSR